MLLFTPLKMIVNYKCIPIFGFYLTAEKADYVKDYRGLAEVIGFTVEDTFHFQRQGIPTQDILYQWGTRPELSPTVDNFI